MPTDLIHRPLPVFRPSDATAAEYAEYNRDYLLFRIEELEADNADLSRQLSWREVAIETLRDGIETLWRGPREIKTEVKPTARRTKRGSRDGG